MIKHLVLILAAVAAASAKQRSTKEDLPPSCDHPVYCDSKLLHHVQLSHIYADSKKFVDFILKQDQDTTLKAFDAVLEQTNNNPDHDTLKAFIAEYFDTNSTELEEWSPEDYDPNPSFLNTIRDDELREFAKNVHAIWPTLGRKVKDVVKEHPEKYSFIPVTNGFIIPGGRFTELYYWDTYWIIEGLLVSEMEETVRGMIENLIELLIKVGHVPNGSRWYYQERSQPPLLNAMMSLYIRKTGDTAFLKKYIDQLESELQYWLDSQVITFGLEGRDKNFTLLRYYAPSKGPRPESYSEDYNNSLRFETEERKQEFYTDIKSAAESGWDFSSRWFIDQNGENTGNLTNIHTEYIIPVDLNSIFANALQTMGYFQTILKNSLKRKYWLKLARQWRVNIEEVLWNEEDGVWYDYDLKDQSHRRYFYPSNVAPLWMGAVEEEYIKKHAPRVIQYLHQSQGLDFPGGIPTSLVNSKEQWDFPNAWPPLVSVVVNALLALEDKEANEMAFDVAQTWVRACYKGYKDSGHMYEKYDAVREGVGGGGGEYDVQAGFGWSNGVVLEFFAKFGQSMTANEQVNQTREPLKVLKVLGISDISNKNVPTNTRNSQKSN